MKMASTHPTMQPPAPSLTLHITKRDGERFLEACGAVKAMMDLQSPKPLHERLFLACEQCSHPLVVQFLERTSSLSEKEAKAAALIFQESDKSTKLRDLFSIFSSTGKSMNREPSLFRAEAASLFRTILTAIHSCLRHSETHNTGDVVVEGKPMTSDRPAKRTKLNSGDATEITKETTDESQIDPSQSRSWDSSLGTLREDDDNASPRKEIEEIVAYAASDLFRYASAKMCISEDQPLLDFATFGSWYNDQGGTIVPWLELLRLSKWRSSRSKSVADNKENKTTKAVSASPSSNPPPAIIPSRTVVSFDFSGSGCPNPLVINITEANLHALKALVTGSNLMQRPAVDVCKILMQNAIVRSSNGQEIVILRKEEFGWTTRSLTPDFMYAQFSNDEKEFFGDSFYKFFSCFEQSKSFLHDGEVDLKEFAVGFCFLCDGNKSAKLAAGFEILDTNKRGFLTEDQLLRYIQSYLTMLVAMSLLTPVGSKLKQKPLDSTRRKAMRQALENGAKWTLGHFLKASNQIKNEYSFESFADWYSAGGYNIAPWLELLDLSKVMSLISEPTYSLDLPQLDNKRGYHTGERRTKSRDRVSSLRRHHSAARGNGSAPEVLFTFPLGSRRSLVVLKDDAAYVRAVVEQLGLLSLKPDDLWVTLSKTVQKRRKSAAKGEVAVYTNIEVFVQSMLEVCPKPSRKRPAPGTSNDALNATQEEILSNFFQCFDIEQCDSVALDELMGGLTMLCGGKKSQKLSFAFGIFDTRPPGKKRGTPSLSGEDLFLFLRSILIVTFSTCRQSLDLSDEMVGRCIADTANMICNDVMRHQWEIKRSDRIDFDEFGQWYNDGGFERAPWLELLDLKKWVLVGDSSSNKKLVLDPPAKPASTVLPPTEDVLDSSFFDADTIMQMDSMDDMDMMLMQTASHDKDDLNRISRSFSYSPRSQRPQPPKPPVKSNPLKFHLNTNDSHGGFMLSLSQVRIRHLRHLLEVSGLYLVELETACNSMLSKSRDNKISKQDFLAVALSILPTQNLDKATSQILNDIFSSIFAGFDREGRGEANALEIACGFTVFCRGKKSDKLEFAFEVLEKNKQGRLAKHDMARYLRSFLTVLLGIAFSSSIDNDPVDDSLTSMSGNRFDRTNKILIEAAIAGSEWAASLAFNDVDKEASMSFDEFADWYTAAGYSSIPWLELLDLQKWALSAESK